jgi:hypothetical protein
MSKHKKYRTSFTWEGNGKRYYSEADTEIGLGIAIVMKKSYALLHCKPSQ